MGHLYDPFWTIKIRLGWQGGVREGKNLPEKWPQFGFGAPQKPPNVPRTPEMDPIPEMINGLPTKITKVLFPISKSQKPFLAPPSCLVSWLNHHGLWFYGLEGGNSLARRVWGTSFRKAIWNDILLNELFRCQKWQIAKKFAGLMICKYNVWNIDLQKLHTKN